MRLGNFLPASSDRSQDDSWLKRTSHSAFAALVILGVTTGVAAAPTSTSVSLSDDLSSKLTMSMVSPSAPPQSEVKRLVAPGAQVMPQLIRGTNVNAPGHAERPGFHFKGLTPEQRQTSFSAQPLKFTPNGPCPYGYRPVFDRVIGHHSPIATTYTVNEVKQVFVAYNFPQGKPPMLSLQLYNGKQWETVRINDHLLTAASPCRGTKPPSLMSFQMTSSRNAVVALFEKGFAKFVDAHPKLRWRDTKDEGYAGLQNIEAGKVMSAITGRQYMYVKSGKGGGIHAILAAANWVVRCMNTDVPCTFSIVNSATATARVGNRISDVRSNAKTGRSNAKTGYYSFFDKYIEQRITLIPNHAVFLVSAPAARGSYFTEAANGLLHRQGYRVELDHEIMGSLVNWLVFWYCGKKEKVLSFI
ncbi:uncharacterized protein N7506_000042 [Penicillium brevicompactum]|uniref:uncharacterized protein n=1 Tax=Penicillium brevicompactum TaxID=5074 RepID=UPI002541046F|nr:uncharacterized protein N7506_000042 [Penicillium brevicompactum]KAJ5346789.1 hypothetical protein N7506_000042 [Penicillium brevicompactum]